MQRRHPPRNQRIGILFMFFIASLCILCVTSCSSFEPIYGAFHHNAIAAYHHWQSKPQVCASHSRFFDATIGVREVVSEHALSFPRLNFPSCTNLSWRYRVDALKHYCNPKINCWSRDGDRTHRRCASTSASASGCNSRSRAASSRSARAFAHMERWPHGFERIH